MKFVNSFFRKSSQPDFGLSEWKKWRDEAGLTLDKLAERAGYAASTISELENHGEGSARLKKRLREVLGPRLETSESEGPRSMSGLQEDAASGPMPTKEDCVNYLKQFLETCERPDQIGWTKIVLLETFPLTRWKKSKP